MERHHHPNRRLGVFPERSAFRVLSPSCCEAIARAAISRNNADPRNQPFVEALRQSLSNSSNETDYYQKINDETVRET
jgi:hypothetical protein